MYKFVFKVPYEQVGAVLQRLVNAEKMADPFNDENGSFSFVLPDSYDGPATVTWNTRQNLMAKAILASMKTRYAMDLA